MKRPTPSEKTKLNEKCNNQSKTIKQLCEVYSNSLIKTKKLEDKVIRYSDEAEMYKNKFEKLMVENNELFKENEKLKKQLNNEISMKQTFINVANKAVERENVMKEEKEEYRNKYLIEKRKS